MKFPANNLDPVGKNEKVLVSSLNQELQDLHFKMKKTKIEAIKAQLQARLTDAFEDHKDQGIKSHEAEVAQENFWFQVRNTYNLWTQNSIGVRAGFAVVETADHDHGDGVCEDCGEDHAEDIKKIIGKDAIAINLSDLVKKMLKKKLGE